ncbi:hypothetical protein ACL07V_34495 [Streptomyces sp. MB22_4]|uniref:hypothetical protein n=1 Tax=Streptomyces sp. MB22_4 TaxID=3383120 RepID=UPI00399F43C4
MTGTAAEVFRRTGCGRRAGVRRWPAGLRLPFVVREVVDDPVAAQRLAGLGVAPLPVAPTADGRAAADPDPAAPIAALPLLTAAHVARRAEGRETGDGAALPAPMPIFPSVVLAAAHHPRPSPIAHTGGPE